MAFVIPSKNIYNKDNDKIRDNKIEQIEVNATEIVPNNEYETPIYNKALELSYNRDVAKDQYIVNREQATHFGAFLEAISGAVLLPFVLEGSILIPRVQNNSWVSKIYKGKKENGSFNIGVSIKCKGYKTNTATASGEIVNGLAELDQTSLTYDRNDLSPIKDEDGADILFNEEQIFVNEVKVYEEYTSPYYEIVATSTAKIEKFTNLHDDDLLIEEVGDNYLIRYKIYCGAMVYRLGYSNTYYGGTLPTTFQLAGEYIEYLPESVEVTFYGNKIGINLKDKVIYVNNETSQNGLPFSVEGNELLQTTNYIEDKNYEQIANIYKNTLNHYKNGKETATILCSIDDYKSTYQYNNAQVSYFAPMNSNFVTFWVELGELAKENISICFSVNGKKYYSICKKGYYRSEDVEVPKDNQELTTKIIGVFQPSMVFQQYDIVIPMVYSARQTDSPMSKYKDGLPKKFEVLSSKLIYDGAVWQELILQETL